MPLSPLDARARALGSPGVGLMGPSLTPVNVASAARILLPTGQITLQPHWVDGDLNGEPVSTHGTRFPHLGLAYPVRTLNGTAVLHIGSFLDQRWEVRESTDQEILGETVPVTDIFKSDGGVSTVQLGWAQRVGDRLSLGVGVGSRIGSVIRTFQRIIDPGGSFSVSPYRTGGEWQYSGLTATAGFQWDPFGALRLGGSVHWSQDLKAKALAAADETTATFDIPTEYRIGATGILTPRLHLSAGMTFADWKPSGDLLDPTSVAGSVLGFGTGLEWAGPTWGIRTFPIRLGYMQTELPFTFQGQSPTEEAFTGGIGLNLVPLTSGYMAVADLGFERGSRDSGSLSESFWRVSVTLRVGSF